MHARLFASRSRSAALAAAVLLPGSRGGGLRDRAELATRVERSLRQAALMSVARHLERGEDHATHIAEMAVKLVRGTDVRHANHRVAP